MKLSQLVIKSDRQSPYFLGIFAFSLLLYTVILVIGVPNKVSQIALAEDAVVFFIASFIWLYLAYLSSGWWGTLTSFAGTLILFATQLSSIWRSGLGLSAFVMSGLFTMTDTAGYYSSALRFLEGGKFFDIAAWRPLAHGVLAVFLGITQQNLQLTIALLVLLTAIACFFMAREIQRNLGTIAAVLTLLVVFMYYRVYLGSVSTESLGLALGALGLGFVWRGATQHQSKSCLLGIFLLTLALNTRAGAFFLLPALILWGAFLFKGAKRFSVSFVLGGFSLIFLGFVVNSLIFKLVSSPDATSFSNFSYSFYGLLVNGDWQTIFRDHPEVLQLTDKEASQRIYEIIFEVLRQNPLSLVRGCIRAWKMFIWDDFVFDFVATANYNNPKINVGLQILSLIGLVSAYGKRETPTGSLIIVATLGILLSVPFVPPWDAGMRPYMATVPFVALIPSLGLAAVVAKMSWRRLQQTPTIRESPLLLWVVAFVLIFLTVGGVFITKVFSNSSNFAEISCPADTEAVYFRNTEGSSVEIVDNKAIANTYTPQFQFDDFKGILNRYDKRYGGRSDTSEMIAALSRLPPQTTITNKISLEDGIMLWIIRSNPLKERGIVGACGTFASNESEQSYLRSLFYSNSESIIE